MQDALSRSLLGAPVGSCLIGNRDFISRARRFRKAFGGAMRQTGFLAAAAAYALTNNFSKLAAVHQLTRKLERGLLELGIEVTERAETCIVRSGPSNQMPHCLSMVRNKVFYDPSTVGTNYAEIAERAKKLPEPLCLEGSRLVVHIQTTERAVDDLLGLVRRLAEEKKAAGFVRSARDAEKGSPKDMYVRKK
jgi:threonine aldolase